MKQVLGGNKIEGHVVLTNTGIIVFHELFFVIHLRSFLIL